MSRRLQALEFGLDRDIALLTLDFGFATSIREKFRSPEIDPRRTAAVLVVNGFYGPRVLGKAVNRRISG